MLQEVFKRMCAAAVCTCVLTPVFAEDHMVWKYEGNKAYWYENGEKQGTVNDPKGVRGDGTVRGREIYSPYLDFSLGPQTAAGWYWLDACYDGAKAVDKEVWLPYVFQGEKEGSTPGKWVRYNLNGTMIKGWYSVYEAYGRWYPDQMGNRYYYDPITGAMAKGYREIDGTLYHFDEVTGVLDADDGWKQVYYELYNEAAKEWQAANPEEDFLISTTVMYLDCDAVPELLVEICGTKHNSDLVLYGIRNGKAVELMNLNKELDQDAHRGYQIFGTSAGNSFLIGANKENHYEEWLCHIEGDHVVIEHAGSFDELDSHANAVIDGKDVTVEEYTEVMKSSLRQEMQSGGNLDFFIDKDYEETLKPGRFKPTV
ncbi:MAG: hypothetical protein IKD69_10285 [Solobacterium sp.]|nr:hypothetical protein [Solobacterium sp.]